MAWRESVGGREHREPNSKKDGGSDRGNGVEVATDQGGARISGGLNGGTTRLGRRGGESGVGLKKRKLWAQQLGYQGRTLSDSEMTAL